MLLSPYLRFFNLEDRNHESLTLTWLHTEAGDLLQQPNNGAKVQFSNADNMIVLGLAQNSRQLQIKTLVSGLAMPRSKKIGATWAKTRRNPSNLATLKSTRSGNVLLALRSDHKYTQSHVSESQSNSTRLYRRSARPYPTTHVTRRKTKRLGRTLYVPESRDPKPQMEMRPPGVRSFSKSDSSLSSLSSGRRRSALRQDMVIGDVRRRIRRRSARLERRRRR